MRRFVFYTAYTSYKISYVFNTFAKGTFTNSGKKIFSLLLTQTLEGNYLYRKLEWIIRFLKGTLSS